MSFTRSRCLPHGGDGESDRARLERWVRATTSPQRLVRRSRIVLLALDGVAADDIAAHLAVSRPTVRLWTKRFAEGGADALLHDAPGRGRPPSLDPSTLRDRLRTANLLDPDGRPTSLRRAASTIGVSWSSLWRALRKNPGLSETVPSRGSGTASLEGPSPLDPVESTKTCRR